jgi:glycosyltransferase involved in cell wall biosynthesis
MSGPNPPKPRVLLLIDVWGWALHTVARAVMANLGDRFAFDLLCAADKPRIEESRYDILHVLCEHETWHRPFLRGRTKVIKSVFSHYWEVFGMSPEEFYAMHLREAHALVVPNTKLLTALSGLPPPVHLVREGVDTHVFRPRLTPREGPLRAGWAGNPLGAIKRFPWVEEACAGLMELRTATGEKTEEEMAGFYPEIDIILCASEAEGCPRPLLEGMACGTFPVSFDVGVAAELIRPWQNGLLVTDVSVKGLRRALEWCAVHPTDVRSAYGTNATIIHERWQWSQTLPALADVYESVL